MPPQPFRNIILQSTIRQMPENSLNLLQNANIIFFPRFLHAILIVLTFIIQYANLLVRIELRIILPTEVFIWISCCPIAGQQSNPNTFHHVQLLQHGIHVTRGTRIFQADKTLNWSRPNWRQIIPFVDR